MAAAAAVQRKSVRLAIVAVRAIRRALALGCGLLLRLLAAASDERRQAVDVLVIARRHGLRPRLEMLRLLLRLLLRLRLLLFARIKRLRLTWCERFAAAHGLFRFTLVVAVIGKIAPHFARLLRLLLVVRLILSKLLLSGSNQPEIMLGVLVIVLRGYRIAGALGITGKLKIFLGNVGCCSPDFHVRSIGLVHARQWILMVMVMATFAVATPHALVLTVSHGLLFRQPLSFAAALVPSLLCCRYVVNRTPPCPAHAANVLQ